MLSAMLGMLLGISSLVLMFIGFRQARLAPSPSTPPALLVGFLNGAVAIPLDMPLWFRIVHLTATVSILVAHIVLYRRTWRGRATDVTSDPRVEFSLPGIGKNPNHLALSADGQIAYVSGLDSGT